METIWLQRSSTEIPWGFRLVGGREFGVPLSVQRVTPGSVAAAGLGSGDVILKVGNVMATGLDHNDAMELVKQAGNILQLTIKKAEGSSSDPLSPGSSFGSAYNDNTGYNTAPKGFGTGIPYNNNANVSSHNSINAVPSYATTPRKPQQMGTRIEIQRVQPQQQSSYGRSYNDGENQESGYSFPDYTIPYKQQDPVHDSPGGPVNIRGYPGVSQSNSYNNDVSQSYNSKTLPTRGSSGYGGGPPSYDPPNYNKVNSYSSPNNVEDSGFTTGVPFQPGPQKTSYDQTYQPSYNQPSLQSSQNTAVRKFAPTQQPYSSSPMSPQSQSSSSFSNKPPSFNNEPRGYSSPNQAPFSPQGSSYDHSNVHGSGPNTYATLPHAKPSFTNNNSSYNVYNSAPQPYSAPKPFTPSQTSAVNFNPTPTPFSPSQNQAQNSYQSPMSPGSSSGYYPNSTSGYQTNSAPSQGSIRRVSFDQSADHEPYSPSSNFSPRLYKSPPATVNSAYNAAPSYGRSSSQQDGYGAGDFGDSPHQPPSLSRQSSRSYEPYSPSPYSVGPMSPRAVDPSEYGYGSRDPSGVSAGLDSLNLGSPRYESSAPTAPPPPPPPPPPSAPPPPPAPPLGDWNPTPYRRQNYQDNAEQDVPDKLLTTMMKATKGGGPKPFSYGIDMSELKQKLGPPTAPKPRGRSMEPDDIPSQQRHYGKPRKPAGQVQSDYFITRDYDTGPKTVHPKKPAGYVQSDYFLSHDSGPRAEIDESPIHLNMGTNPKKQSKSFKVLQWMTETEQDEEGKEESEKTGEANQASQPSQKARRNKDPDLRHNAEDDEMRFTGLHSKADIPSKAFERLKKMPVTENGKNMLTVEDDEDGVGNYDETSIRYKGKHIPSPSFRVLQTWAEHDPDTNLSSQPGDEKKKKEAESEDDGLPDTLDGEDMVDKRYKGGNIPSKVFKVLQQSVGGDEETQQPSGKAVSDF